MNDIEELVRVRLRAAGDQVNAPWRAAAVIVERRASTFARRRVMRARTLRATAFVVAAASIVGIVATTRRDPTRHRPASVITTDPPPVTPYLPTYLPDGFTLEKAQQFINTGFRPPVQAEWYRIYRNSGTPMGAATIMLSWTASNEQQRGTPAGLHGEGLSRFEIRDGKPISYGGKGVTEAELLAAAASAAPVGDGYELRQLPVGWELVASIDNFDGFVTGSLGASFTTSAGRKGPVLGLSVSPQPDEYLEITAGVSTEDATSTDPVRGRPTLAIRCGAKCDPRTSDVSLMWREAPGIVISLGGPGVAEAELRKVAESLQPIPDEQWLALVNKTSPPPVTIPVRGELRVPRYGLAKPLAGWRLTHSSTTGTVPGQAPSRTTLRYTMYRDRDAAALDPYIAVIVGGDESYSVGANGVVQSTGDVRSIGWHDGGRVLVVRSYRLPEAELVRLADYLHGRDVTAALPETLGGLPKASEHDGSRPSRYDSIGYETDGATLEIHNQSGKDLIELLDERLDGSASAEAITVAGHTAVVTDVSSGDSNRFWVLWAEPDGVVEIDVTGVGRQQLGSLLASVGKLGEQEYEAIFAPR